MKYLPVCATCLLLSAGLAPVAQAQLDVTLSTPDVSVSQGTTIIAFDAVIANTSASTVFLNGDSASTVSPLLGVNDAPFFANAPIDLASGQSSGLIELFDVTLGPTIPIGSYLGNTFTILGGSDGFAADTVGAATFSVNVSGGGVTAAPELDPDALGAALTLLAGSLMVLRSGYSRSGR